MALSPVRWSGQTASPETLKVSDGVPPPMVATARTCRSQPEKHLRSDETPVFCAKLAIARHASVESFRVWISTSSVGVPDTAVTSRVRRSTPRPVSTASPFVVAVRAALPNSVMSSASTYLRAPSWYPIAVLRSGCGHRGDHRIGLREVEAHVRNEFVGVGPLQVFDRRVPLRDEG